LWHELIFRCIYLKKNFKDQSNRLIDQQNIKEYLPPFMIEPKIGANVSILNVKEEMRKVNYLNIQKMTCLKTVSPNILLN
jgi:hypothetical protein